MRLDLLGTTWLFIPDFVPERLFGLRRYLGTIIGKYKGSVYQIAVDEFGESTTFVDDQPWGLIPSLSNAAQEVICPVLKEMLLLLKAIPQYKVAYARAESWQRTTDWATKQIISALKTREENKHG